MEIEAPLGRKARMLLLLRRSGVTNAAVLDAMERVDRSAFIDAAYKDFAYDDAIAPIAAGQTLARPREIGTLFQAADIKPDKSARVLLIGAGCGYLAALLAEVSKEVFGVERFARLVERTTDRLAGMGIQNITLKVGDGLEGWKEKGPFDRIILAGSVPNAPVGLAAQLAGGGMVIAPVRKPEGDVIRRLASQGETTDIQTPYKYQRLVEGESEAL